MTDTPTIDRTDEIMDNITIMLSELILPSLQENNYLFNLGKEVLEQVRVFKEQIKNSR